LAEGDVKGHRFDSRPRESDIRQLVMAESKLLRRPPVEENAGIPGLHRWIVIERSSWAATRLGRSAQVPRLSHPGL